MSSMDGYPEFEAPISPQDQEHNDAIRRALGSQAFIEIANRRGGTILRRTADGTVEELPGSTNETPSTETDEDNQGEQ